MKKIKLIKAKESIDKVKAEYKKQVSTAVMAAFGFIIAFAWRDLIQSIIDRLMKSKFVEGTIAFANRYSLYSLIYAVLVTIICVIGIILVSKWSAKQEKK